MRQLALSLERLMSMPLSQDYNEAIQSPAASFSDPDLKQGEAATNALGLPMPRSGNFADVYELRTPRGRWAIKCFTRAIPGLRERYKEISAYLKQTPLPFMVDFSFIEKGIRVRNDSALVSSPTGISCLSDVDSILVGSGSWRYACG